MMGTVVSTRSHSGDQADIIHYSACGWGSQGGDRRDYLSIDGVAVELALAAGLAGPARYC